MYKSILSRVESNRQKIIASLKSDSRGQNGQFMTPAIVAQAMANMFSTSSLNEIRVLDPGAGAGSLMSAFFDMVMEKGCHGSSFSIVAYELDTFLASELRNIAKAIKGQSKLLNCEVDTSIIEGDFIFESVTLLRHEFDLFRSEVPLFSHVIINPPYRKLSADSKHRKALRSVGIEANNFYAAFVALSIKLLKEGGELVAITPRSFCNGPYFRSFRRLLATNGRIRRIHIFESRQSAFKEDDVLQENIIFHYIKGKPSDSVLITSSGITAVNRGH